MWENNLSGQLDVRSVIQRLCWWLLVKNSPANAKDVSSIPGSGRSLAEGNGNSLQYSSWKSPWTEEPGRL